MLKLPKPREEMTERDWEKLYLSCPKCGLERDSEGWCPNYCAEGDDDT